MLRFTGLAVIGVGAVGALAMLGTDRWVASGYDAAAPRAVVAGESTVGDEAFWLTAARPKAVTPAAAAGSIEHFETRTFEVGARLTVAGATRLHLDIVATTVMPADSGLLDPQGRPLILVTARERKGTRIVRFLVEADAVAPRTGEKSL